MDALAAGLTTKADKIRALSRAGYSRSQIAKFLRISYQHVRNVQVDDERRSGSHALPASQPKPAAAEPAQPFVEENGSPAVKVDVASNGCLMLPPALLEAAGLSKGGFLLARFAGGEIRLVTPETAMRRSQART